MLADLNAMLQADARGEHTQEQFEEFMGRHGEFFPSQPETLEELVDDLARRAAAQQRLMDSLTPEQRQELGELMQGAMDLDLQRQLGQLGDSLRAARPDLPWGGRERMRGEQGLGVGRGDRRAGGAGRPRRPRGGARPGLPGRVARRHRRGRPCSARSAARRSTTWRRCAASSAS